MQSYVKVLFDYEYTPSGSSDKEPKIKIFKNEELVLLRKATSVWWHVFRVTELKAFYAPADYLEEIISKQVREFATANRMISKPVEKGKPELGRKRSNSLDAFSVQRPTQYSSGTHRPHEKRSSWAVNPHSSLAHTAKKNLQKVQDLSDYRRNSAPEKYLSSTERELRPVSESKNGQLLLPTPEAKFSASKLSDASKAETTPVPSKEPVEAGTTHAPPVPAPKVPLLKSVPPRLPPKVAKKPMPAPRDGIKLRNTYINISQTDIPNALVRPAAPGAQQSEISVSLNSRLVPKQPVSTEKKPLVRQPVLKMERQLTIAVIDTKSKAEPPNPKSRPEIDLNKYRSAKPLTEKPKMPAKSKTYVAPSSEPYPVSTTKPVAGRKQGVFSRLFSKEPVQPVGQVEKTRKLSSEKLKSPLFGRKISKQEMAVAVPVTISEHEEKSENEGPSLYVANPMLQFLRQPSLRGNGKSPKNSPGSVETLSSGTGLQDSSSELEDRGSKNSLDSLGSAFTSESTSGIASESPGARSPSSQDETRSEDKLKLTASTSDPSRVYSNVNYCTFPATPPSPGQNDLPVRQLHDGWAEYSDQGGRIYYYQTGTAARSWKPPRRLTGSPKLDNCSGDEDMVTPNLDSAPDPLARSERPKLKRELSTFGVSATLNSDVNGNSAGRKPGHPEDGKQTIRGAPLPPGWIQQIDPHSKKKFYVHPFSKTKWYTSVDKEGRLYYFEENSNESVWVLPDVQPVTSEKHSQPTRKQAGTTPESLLPGGEKENLQNNPSLGSVRPRQVRDGASSVDRKAQAMSQSFLDSSFSSEPLTRSDVTVKTASLPRDTSQLPYLNVIRHGLLNKTKITENGKKTRKHWTSSYCILSDQFLLLYKDKKSATQSRPGSTPAKPELSLDLNGSSSEWCANKSSRKNVFQLSTIFGLQILLQEEDGISARQWYEAIRSAIGQLPSGLDKSDLNNSSSSEYLDRSSGSCLGPPDDGKKSKLTRTKSAKIKSGSIEDLTKLDSDHKNVRDQLRKFFGRRPTIESLAKKGIWKDEPVFGSTLKALSIADESCIPKFVEKIIRVIESKEEYLETDGLYRASGNLSQVQNIRVKADLYQFQCIDQEEDVHVLSGALKLFFRELKEPAIPTWCFVKALEISGNKNRNERVKKFRELLSTFPKENYETLKFLFTHLLKVTEYREKNRMHVSNLAIVFGPTLMWPATESLNLALDMMQQNLVIESLLIEFKQVFVK